MRPTILVDLDNVVYDWVKAMALFVKRNGGAVGFDIPRMLRSYSKWEVWEDWNMTKGEFMRWWRLGVEQGDVYNMPELGPMKGAREALWALSDAEWNIHIATSRLNVFGTYDKVVADTSHWLGTNSIPFREISFVNNKHRLFANAIVDDRFQNMDPASHGRCFLFAAPHNEGLGSGASGILRVLDWDQVLLELNVS